MGACGAPRGAAQAACSARHGMGVGGFLAALKDVTVKKHVSEYAGRRVAVDGYCWLHRAAYTCAADLAEGRPTTKWLSFVTGRVNLLRAHNVEPIVVFDGARLPAKAGEESRRQMAREEHLSAARRHAATGNHGASNDAYQKAVDITPAMAHVAIKALAKLGVRTLVAPYEADAQMAYLERTGEVSAIITEDSDLVGGYCCKCVFFKMDKQGNGEELRMDALGNSRSLRMQYFTEDMVRQMCVLAGCDFLPSVRNCGLKTAHKYISRCKRWQKALQIMRLEGFVFPPTYEADFQKALWTFKHQMVYDSNEQRGVYLTELSDDLKAVAASTRRANHADDTASPPAGADGARMHPQVMGIHASSQQSKGSQLTGSQSLSCGARGALVVEDLSFLGPPKDDATLREIACGNVDPMTHEPFREAAAPKPQLFRPGSLPAAFKGAMPSTAHAPTRAHAERPRGGQMGQMGVSTLGTGAAMHLQPPQRAAEQPRQLLSTAPIPQPRMGGRFLSSSVRSGGVGTLPIGKAMLKDFALGGRMTRPSQNALKPFKPPALNAAQSNASDGARAKSRKASKFFAGLPEAEAEAEPRCLAEGGAAGEPDPQQCVEPDGATAAEGGADVDVVEDSDGDDGDEAEGRRAKRRARRTAAVAAASLDRLEASIGNFRRGGGAKGLSRPALPTVTGSQKVAAMPRPSTKRDRANFDTFRL